MCWAFSYIYSLSYFTPSVFTVTSSFMSQVSFPEWQMKYYRNTIQMPTWYFWKLSVLKYSKSRVIFRTCIYSWSLVEWICIQQITLGVYINFRLLFYAIWGRYCYKMFLNNAHHPSFLVYPFKLTMIMYLCIVVNTSTWNNFEEDFGKCRSILITTYGS